MQGRPVRTERQQKQKQKQNGKFADGKGKIADFRKYQLRAFQAISDIAKDLLIYRLFGCSNDGKVVAMKANHDN